MTRLARVEKLEARSRIGSSDTVLRLHAGRLRARSPELPPAERTPVEVLQELALAGPQSLGAKLLAARRRVGRL